MEHPSNRRIKLNLEDLQVESFEPLPAQVANNGTIRGYESLDPTCQSNCQTACASECATCVQECDSEGGGCDSFDTCPELCATVVQMC